MHKARRMLVMGLGAVTPAFVAAEGAQARSVASGTPAVASDQQALKSGLLALTPAEKLRIGGDSIRLAQTHRGTATQPMMNNNRPLLMPNAQQPIVQRPTMQRPNGQPGTQANCPAGTGPNCNQVGNAYTANSAPQ